MSVTDQLLRLYRVDQQLSGLRSRVQAAARYHDAQQRQLADFEARREQLRSQSRQLAAAARNLETEIQTHEGRIVELRKRMNEVHSSKEYTALLTELNTVKADKDRLESAALEELGKVDALNAQAAEVEKQIEERAKVRDVARQQLQQEQAQIQSRLTELEAQRAAAAAEAPPDVLREFDALGRRTEGEPMAEIVEQDRRRLEYCCGACNMEIPVERLSRLMARNDITHCPSCRRILFINEETREVLDKRVANRS